MDIELLDKFRITRRKKNDTAQNVADEFGCSRQYLYMVIEEPGKNEQIYQQILDYIQEADL